MEKRENSPHTAPQGRGKPTAPMLINHISRMFDERMRSLLPAGHPMTQNSCRFIMGHLSHHDGITQQELVSNTNMKAPTISVALRTLEEEGWVKREQDPGDLRSVRVYLTEEGRRVDEEFREKLRKTDQLLMQGISEEEEETLIRLLLAVRENIRPEHMKKEKTEST
ncbi:MAG: MarR family transcriptional regulator [Clostridia bacterium]|nr:MarR family transcriptional regulator [Clostridia bacterium]